MKPQIETSKLKKKLKFIQSCYTGFTLKESVEKIGVSVSTGERWLKTWNKKGLSSLDPKPKEKPPYLSDKNKVKLKN